MKITHFVFFICLFTGIYGGFHVYAYRHRSPLAYLTFIWTGIVFLFFAISLPVDLVAWLMGKTSAQPLHATLDFAFRLMSCVLSIGEVLIPVEKRFDQFNIEN